MTALRALVFDVFGTVVDWRTGVLAGPATWALAPGCGDWAAVVDDWRRAYQPALLAARRASAWRDLDALHGDSLARTCWPPTASSLPADEHGALVQSWRRLPAWPDARPGLDRLRRRYVTATLSNGHVALLVDLLRYATCASTRCCRHSWRAATSPTPSST